MKRGGSWVRRTLSAGSLLNILGGALAPRDRSPPRKRHRRFESVRSQSSVASLAVVEAAATPVAGAGPFAAAGASSLVVRAALALALALLAVLAALALASDTGPRASTLLPHGVRATAETWAMKFQWDAAALASSWRALPAAVANDATNRDEYGLLTLDAQCAALRERDRDPRWPLRNPSTIIDDGLDRLGFASAAQLCDAMASLPRTLRVYTHPLGDEEKRRYAAARMAPTFNRGYDVEEHVATNLGPAGPFAEADPAKANAFLIPARPYLERVAAFPNSGRDAQVANTAKLVARVKREDAEAWRAANPGCGRIFVSAHDTGASAARLTDDAVRDRAVFIVSNADITSDAERDAAVAAWASKRSHDGRDEGAYEGDESTRTLPAERDTESRMDVDKDVSAVCSLSYHLPRDAVAFGAMRPVFLDDDGGDGDGDGARKKSAPDGGDERRIEMSFRGSIRGGVRERILGHYLSGAVDVQKLRWDLRSNGQVSPRRYTSLMRDSKFCLHVRGTRVQSPRLIEGMLFGCVPVILADGYAPPLSWLLDWSKFSVRLPEIEYERLPEVLEAANWAELHENLRRVVPFFVYHRTPIPGDALWTTALGTQRQIERGEACEGVVEGDETDVERSVVAGEADRGSRRVRKSGRRLKRGG